MCAIMEVSLTRKEQTTMTGLYDYISNINVVTTPNGDKVITMNGAIYTKMVNDIYDSAEQAFAEGRKATAEDTMNLWRKLVKFADTVDIDK